MLFAVQLLVKQCQLGSQAFNLKKVFFHIYEKILPVHEQPTIGIECKATQLQPGIVRHIAVPTFGVVVPISGQAQQRRNRGHQRREANPIGIEHRCHRLRWNFRHVDEEQSCRVEDAQLGPMLLAKPKNYKLQFQGKLKFINCNFMESEIYKNCNFMESEIYKL